MGSFARVEHLNIAFLHYYTYTLLIQTKILKTEGHIADAFTVEMTQKV